MSIGYPILQLRLAEYEDMKEEHLKIIRQFFNHDLPALLDACNEQLIAATAKRRPGRPDVEIISIHLLDFDNVME